MIEIPDVSFWSNYDKSNESITKLLDNESSTIEEFLDDDVVTDEVKLGNERLLTQ